MEPCTTPNIISPNWVGVITCVFLFRDKYLIFTSFLIISALVALVPIPDPLICALRSSSSISCPAFSIARISEPDVYLLGGEVSPSFISVPDTGILSPFFILCKRLKKSSSKLNSEFSLFSSFVPSTSSCFALFFFSFGTPAISRYPLFTRILKLELNCSVVVVSSL